MKVMRLIAIAAGLIIVWQVTVLLTGAPPYILPGPLPVAKAAFAHSGPLFDHAMTTLFEIIGGLLLGTLLGALSALSMIASLSLKRWLLPVLVISQAIPVFAIAPLLVLWLGFGMSSKIAMTVLIIFFPVTAAFYDGLRSTEPEWLELAHVMNAKPFVLVLLSGSGLVPAKASDFICFTPMPVCKSISCLLRWLYWPSFP